MKIWKLPLLLTLICAAPSAFAQSDTETVCDDRVDNDGDGLIDCGDADCFEDQKCKSSGGLENSNTLCSDFIDNDGDGASDCEDMDCNTNSVSVCRGSWRGDVGGTGAANQSTASNEEIPELGEGMTVEDLIGKGGDVDGERNDYVCSDGIDNDGDGKVDCGDIGCRFDPNVTVCRGTPGLRFSLAANVMQSYSWGSQIGAEDSNGNGLIEPGEEGDIGTGQWDTRFRRLQLRAFGPVPGIQDSFFLISMLMERTPRLTFAMFSMPIYKQHKININSGGGGLSNALVLSVAKNPLLDPPYYVYSAFEAGNGAALEFSGPLLPGTLDYRVFAAGGGGRFNGNIGGRFLNFDELNYAWGVGAQVAYYAVGRFDRWDTRYLYTEVPLGLAVYLGGRYDQREFDRFPAANLNVLFRWWLFEASVEAYGKRELEFGAWQGSFNGMVGFLIWPKHLFLAADIGMFRATEYDDPLPIAAENELTRIPDEFGVRAALHWYVWKNNGILTLWYGYQDRERALRNEVAVTNNELRLEAQIRF